MPEFFLELFSEEIPARMQQQAAADLSRLLTETLAPLSPVNVRTWHGPRRVAFAADMADGVPGRVRSERGPRAAAAAAALAGFLRKHGAAREDLTIEGDFFVLARNIPPRAAAAAIADALPGLLWKFPWPKSMRWGASAFTWVRPLRRIVAILDGAVVPFALAQGEDRAHGLASGNLTEGHRFHAPGAFAVESAADWEARLRERHVIAADTGRAGAIHDGLTALAGARGLVLADDPGLLDEVAGLTEWPVPLLGPIDAAYMDLPPEVMQVSMRVNQRYFALRNADGSAASWFGFAANIAAADGGAAIVAGNARVLRARFADARHFWDLDRQTRLADRVEALRGVTFHAKLGTQYDRAQRIAAIARALAPHTGADPDTAARAGLLAKADLTTGMVGEFPELQGVMGGYYARHDGEPGAVADAIRDHYQPRGAEDAPVAPVSITVGLADRIDLLFQFFAIGEKPTGSGDPFALRRAALGIIRLITGGGVRLRLNDLAHYARDAAGHLSPQRLTAAGDTDVVAFILERLRVQLRGAGERHDVLEAILGAPTDLDIITLLERTRALAMVVQTEDGANLVAAYRRAANILRIEDKKDGPHRVDWHAGAFERDEERGLVQVLTEVEQAMSANAIKADYRAEMQAFARLRQPMDAFFDNVTVNADEPALRLNRLRILASVKAAMDRVADFSKIVE